MLGLDVWTWAGIMVVLGPVLAGLAIPVFRWLFEEPTRLLVMLVFLGGLYWKYQSSRVDVPQPSPSPIKAGSHTP